MKVRLTPRAERQLAALPEPAARKLVSVLRLQQAAPKIGRRYPDDSEFRGLFYKSVVVRPRRWTYRVTFELRQDELVVLYLYHGAYPVTHLDLASMSDDRSEQ